MFVFCSMTRNSSNIFPYYQDTHVKFWDLTTQHCFKTLTGHVTEVWDLVLVENDSLLITGGSDPEIKIWKLAFKVFFYFLFIEIRSGSYEYNSQFFITMRLDNIKDCRYIFSRILISIR